MSVGSVGSSTTSHCMVMADVAVVVVKVVVVSLGRGNVTEIENKTLVINNTKKSRKNLLGLETHLEPAVLLQMTHHLIWAHPYHGRSV